MSNISNGSVTSKSSSRTKFSTQLKDLLGAAKRVLSHEDIGSLDQILDEKQEVEGKLKSKTAEVLAKDKVIASKDHEIATLRSAKNAEIANLQLTNNSLFDEFQKRYKIWDTGTTKQEELEVEVAQLKLKLKQAIERANSSEGGFANLQQELAKYKSVLRETEESLKIVRKELASKERELTGAVKGLEILQKEKAELGLEDLNLESLLAIHCLIND